MAIDRKTLFASLRRLFGPFDQHQVDLVNAIVDAFSAHKLTDVRWLSYILATAWHECLFRSIREGDGKGVGITDAQARVRVAKWCRDNGCKNYAAPHPRTGLSYYGRGCPQTTHYPNYVKLEKRFGLPFSTNPDLLLITKISAMVTVVGMVEGIWMGHKLSDYFNGTRDDPVGARRIINGADKAQLIAGYHRDILKVLVEAEADADKLASRKLPSVVVVPPPPPSPTPAAEPPSIPSEPVAVEAVPVPPGDKQEPPPKFATNAKGLALLAAAALMIMVYLASKLGE